jgi:predicted nucleotidyltransferase
VVFQGGQGMISGIIAEYNPFHRGHEYQVRYARETLGADYVIVAMSGDFVQRGEPAVLDKYVRASMALNSGVNLVVELPVNYAVSSAENFAAGALKVLDYIKADSIAFGRESQHGSISQTCGHQCCLSLLYGECSAAKVGIVGQCLFDKCL